MRNLNKAKARHGSMQSKVLPIVHFCYWILAVEGILTMLALLLLLFVSINTTSSSTSFTTTTTTSSISTSTSRALICISNYKMISVYIL